MKIKLFLTFDHELPLGGLNASYKEALFDPTEKVMKIAEQHGIKVTFFSDILCAERYKTWDFENFYLPYKEQLQKAISKHHDIQLHIHPHWLTSTYNGKEFIPSNDFALSHFKDKTEFGGIQGVIKHAIAEMNDICLATDKDYQCIAFRAGGYNIYPDTKLIFDALYDLGIRYDSSIAKGFYYKSTISEIDYRKLPNKPNWIVNTQNYRLASSDENGILEIPIATIPKTPFELPTRFKLKKYAFRAVENRGKIIHEEGEIDLYSKIKMLFSARMLSFDNHTLSLDYLLRILKYNMNKYQNLDEVMLSVISHPKSMGDYSFELMGRFIAEVKKSYPEVEFTTFSQYVHKTGY